jgi:glycogen operon protein
MKKEDWEKPHTRSFGLRIRAHDTNVLILFNAHFEPISFERLPQTTDGPWRVAVDTATGEIDSRRAAASGEAIEVAGRSLVVLRDAGG